MAETARRMGYGHGSDVVRRLIARPIRQQATMAARPVVAQSASQDVSTATAQSPVATAGEDVAAPPPDADAARLQVEMTVLKAVLRAERRENASLRACVGFDAADASLGKEARAVRDQWAALVDRLLHVAP